MDGPQFGVSYRIKTDGSIEDKIHRYIWNSNLNGNAPLDRRLNDLCGVRAIVKCDMVPQRITDYTAMGVIAVAAGLLFLLNCAKEHGFRSVGHRA